MANKLFVGNVPFNTKEDELKTLFSEFGTVVSVMIPINKMDGRPRGFAFVEMSTDEEASKAMSLDGKDFSGRPLAVKEAQPKREDRGGYDNR